MRTLRQVTIGVLAPVAVMAGLLSIAGEAQAASPAAFTTDVNGAAVNANRYDNKCDVYLNGGPDGAQLDDGSYVFFVLAPGGQADPNANLLSSDANGNRTFAVSGASVTYSGTHGTSLDENNKPLIQLCQYADTTNAGGVYILAICDATNLTPSGCKYDAFKVKAASNNGDDLVAVKTATPTYTRTYDFDINKAVDRTYVQTSNATATFNYTVTVTKNAAVDSNFVVSGTVQVFNPNAAEVTGVGVTDGIGSISCTVTDGATSIAAGGNTTFHYSCPMPNDPTQSGTNTATVSWDKTSINSTNDSATATAPYDFSAVNPNVVGDCTTVTDSINGGTVQILGTTCASKAFTYARTLSVPSSGCLTYTNTAVISSGEFGSRTVQVCRTNSDGYTIGYWQNKNGQARIKTSAAGLCTYLARYNSVLTLPSSCTGTSLPKYVSDVITVANASGDGVAMYRAQFLATALNAYFSSALASTPVQVPGTLLGTGNCITVTQLLAAGNSQFSALQANKTSLLAVKDVFDRINNNNQLTC